MSTSPEKRRKTSQLTPGMRVGSYEIVTLLGSGGMGTVFAARHVGLHKPVAIKALHPSLARNETAVRRFVQEGRAVARIRHPHVVDITDVGTHEGIPYLVMEYLEGDDLEARVKKMGRLRIGEISHIMLPVLDAVASAHEEGVIHRDLKPANIFLSRGRHGMETPKVLDFGIAKLLETDQFDRVTLTRNASFLGTPYYSSPEQAQSGKHANALSDQFSLGAILYELVTGEHAVDGETPFEILSAIIADKIRPIREVAPDVDARLAALIERAMAHAPEARFPSVRALGHALLQVAEPEDRALWKRAFQVTTRTQPGTAFAASNPKMAAMDFEAFAETMDGRTHRAPVAVDPKGEPEGEPGAPTERLGELPAPSPAGFTAPQPATPAVPVQPAPERRSRGASLGVALIAVLLVSGLGAGAAWYTSQDRSPPTPPSFASAPISVEPEEAEIEIDGALVGAGTASVPRDGRAHRVRITAPGYEPFEVEIPAGEPPPAVVTLESSPVAEPDPPTDPEPEDVVAEGTPPEDGETEDGETEDGETEEGGEAVVAPEVPEQREPPARRSLDPWVSGRRPVTRHPTPRAYPPRRPYYGSGRPTGGPRPAPSPPARLGSHNAPILH